MAQSTKSQRDRSLANRRDWYSLSLDTVRGWGIFLALLVTLAVGVTGYRVMQRLSLERQAMIVIDEAEFLLTRVQTEAGGGTTSASYNEAWQNLQQARRQVANGEFDQALVSARWSRNLFSSILDDLRNKGPSGEGQFVGVSGSVEFRRGDGPWQVARSRIVLRSGDYVKTGGNGSAEVEFSDGTSFRVRPDTVVLISRRRTESGAPTEEAVTLEYGWLNLDTTTRGSRVRTPEAEARIAESSRVELTYDRDRRISHFSSYQGEMEVRSRVGTIRRVGTMEQVTMTAAGMSAPVALPASPQPMWPEPTARLELADGQVVISWGEVRDASRYALQVSRDGHFVDNIIDVEDRLDNTATVGLLQPGTVLWRVAAFNRTGYKGPWSEPRAFAVVDGSQPSPAERRRGGSG